MSVSIARPAVLAAAVASGVTAAMIVEIMLEHRGVVLTAAWRGAMHAALAWWAITGGAFLASFVIAAVMSRFEWLYFRSLRWIAAAILVAALALVAAEAPLAASDAAGHHALATLAALLVAMLMASFGAFFALRR